MDLASGSAWNLFVLECILGALHLASGSLLVSIFALTSLCWYLVKKKDSMVRMDRFVAEQQIHHQAVHCHLHHGFLHS
ncbi:hypothetical protein DAI22_02g157600 [Oryza sativa Japonica Group]|nr:hypothetical protein DAI22_02g157600 [Oryza sativa Japonica Group]